MDRVTLLWGLSLLMISSFDCLVEGSHFRGGIIMVRPKPGGILNEMLISFRVSWRRSSSAGGSCDDAQITAGTLFGEGSLKCLAGCSNTISDMKYRCTDFSLQENWSYGVREIDYTFPNSIADVVDIGFTGSAWISPFSGKWHLSTMVNLKVRADTGKQNSSPRAVTAPVVRLQAGCEHTVHIATSDPDGDRVRCRFATSDCGSICQRWPGAVIDEDNCIIQYDATSERAGYRAAALVLEDYPRNSGNSTKSLSSVSLQFLVLVYDSDELCSTVPIFVDPTFQQDTCIAIPFGETFNTSLTASTGGKHVSLSEIQTVSPPGLRKSSVLHSEDGLHGSVNITWTPTVDQQNQISLFCFTATNSAGASSEQRCIRFAVGSYPPKPISVTPNIVRVHPNMNTWRLTFDQLVVLSNRTAHINFYEDRETPFPVYQIDVSKSSEVKLMNNSLTFTPGHSFAEKRDFYITFDRGIVRGIQSCGPENEPVTDKEYWTFRTRDVTPPVIKFTEPYFDRTSENVTIAWVIDEEVNFTSAWLVHGSSKLDFEYLNDTSRITGLPEGTYIFNLMAVDWEGNTANASFQFLVDLTPPEISFQVQFSDNISKHETDSIAFRCNEPGCRFQCKYGLIGVKTPSELSFFRCVDYVLAQNQKNEESYFLLVQATDIAGNKAEKEFHWTVDLEKPTIMPVSDTHASCLAKDLSPVLLGMVTAIDNLDPNPKVSYSDTRRPCSVERNWVASDQAGNIVKFKQTINLTYDFVIASLPEVDAKCDSYGSQETIAPVRTAHVPNPCQRPISLISVDDVMEPECPGIIKRIWTASDECSGLVRNVSQTITLYDICPAHACAREEMPPHGICSEGICKCNRPWYGNNCETLILDPKIANISSMVIREGEDIEIQPTLIEGTPPITWSLQTNIKFMRIDPMTGRLTLKRATAGVHKIKVEAENTVASNRREFELIVNTGYIALLLPIPQREFGTPVPIQFQGIVQYHNDSIIGDVLSLVVPVVVDIEHKGIHRTLRTFAYGQNFNVIFHPLPHEYGLFSASARHPNENLVGANYQNWTIDGMRTVPSTVSVSGETLNEFDKQFLNIATIINDGPRNLVNVQPVLPNNFRDIQVEVFLNATKIPINVGQGESLSVSVRITSESGFSIGIPLQFVSQHGTTSSLLLRVNIRQKLPTFIVTPSSLNTQISRGIQRVLDFNITNEGKATANDVKLNLPANPIISLLSNGYIGKSTTLATGENLTPSVLLQIPSEHPLGEITGRLLITARETHKELPFRILVTSNNILNLVVIVEDEFTYFAEGKPLVSNANVHITNRNRKVFVSKSTMEGNGSVTFENLYEDRYELRVSAPKHKTYKAVIIASPDKPRMKVFLERTAVEYTWTVTPTEVVDSYTITLEADFEAKVPMPVVTVQPTVFDLEEIELGYIDTLEINITNHGLIRAENVDFTLPANHPFLKFTTLVEKIEYLDAQSSIVVPVKVSRKSREKRNVLWIIYGIKIGYSFVCGDWKFRSLDVLLRKREIRDGPTIPFQGIPYRGSGGPGFGGGSLFNFNGYSASTPVFCNDCFGAFLGCLPGPNFPLAGCIPMLAGGPPKVEGVKDALDWIDCIVPIEIAIPPRGGSGNGGGRGGSKGGRGGSGGNLKWGPISCALDLYDKCIKNDDGDSSRRKKRGVQAELISNFAEALQAVQYSIEIASEILGNGVWLEIEDHSWVTSVVKPAFDDLSDGGSLITQQEYQRIIDSSAPNGTTKEDVENLILRLNNTITNWREGVLEPDAVQKSNMASFSYILDLSKTVQAFDTKAKNLGFKSYIDAYNDVNVKARQLDNIEEEAGVCAVVRIRIEQELALTREGFIAKLEIKNGENSALSDIQVEIYITNKETGQESTSLFSIGNATYFGDVGKEGSLSPEGEGAIEWLLIPYSEAAPEEQALYDVGGTLSYELEEKEVKIPLLPAQIRVSPDPRLIIHYFWEKYVLSDDPFTEIVEQAVPFTLGVAIANRGYGTSYGMRIASAQPVIIENEKGLAISFKIIGSMIGNEESTPSLTVDFGDIGPNVTRIARWWMTSSLKGQFSNYSATFENKNPLGDPKLSLIDSLDVHELIRNVKVPNDDKVLDFLVNDDKEIDVYPDALYSSADLKKYPVTVGDVISFTTVKTSSNMTWQLRVSSNNTGWNYFRLDTSLPSTGKYQVLGIMEVTQDDTQTKPTENVWLTEEIGDKNSDTLILHMIDSFTKQNATALYDIHVCSVGCSSFEPTTEGDSNRDHTTDIDISNGPTSGDEVTRNPLLSTTPTDTNSTSASGSRAPDGSDSPMTTVTTSNCDTVTPGMAVVLIISALSITFTQKLAILPLLL